MYDVVKALHEQGLRTPVLLRFLDIVADRIDRLHVGAGGGPGCTGRPLKALLRALLLPRC